MSRKGDKTNVLKLNLMDVGKTWFRWSGSDHSVLSAPASVFDAWISQYVDTIVNVDRATWEIFHRWNIINACIDGKLLELKQREDGSQILEEKASEVEAGPEDMNGDNMASEAV